MRDKPSAESVTKEKERQRWERLERVERNMRVGPAGVADDESDKWAESGPCK